MNDRGLLTLRESARFIRSPNRQTQERGPPGTGSLARSVMDTPTRNKTSTRRRFVKVAAAGAAASVAAPSIAKAQRPISMRFQSTWPSKDIFHEYALDYAK